MGRIDTGSPVLILVQKNRFLPWLRYPEAFQARLYRSMFEHARL